MRGDQLAVGGGYRARLLLDISFKGVQFVEESCGVVAIGCLALRVGRDQRVTDDLDVEAGGLDAEPEMWVGATMVAGGARGSRD